MTAHSSSSRPQLEARFTPPDHDPLILTSLLFDEVDQRRQTGYDVDEFVVAANRLRADDERGILEIVDDMAESERPDWPWEEPDGLEHIQASLTLQPSASSIDDGAFRDQVHAAWLGRIVGCNLGKPLEWGDHWTVAHIEDYLRRADAYPLTDYVPVLDPMPPAFELNESWIFSARGRIDGSARDDDIDYSILALHLLETHGAGLTPAAVGDAWTRLLPLRQVFTAERAAYVNLTRGLTGDRVARFRNPYREWIGAQIRADVYGYVHPGDPWAAAALAFQDASLSHTGNGVYGAMWAAALVSAAFTADSAREAVEIALGVVPPRSRLAGAIRFVLDQYDAGLDWKSARTRVGEEYGQYSWVHTINNAAIVVLALLWGESDFTTAVSTTVMSGLDTDSNGATVGSVAGILAGRPAALPTVLVEPLHDRTRSALFGFDNSRISDLAERTIAVAESGGWARSSRSRVV